MEDSCQCPSRSQGDENERAFSHCSRLSIVNLGEGLEEIGFHIIVGCTPLQCIVIPFTVKGIRDGAFCHCQQLTTVQLNERLEDTLRNAL